MYAAAPRFLNPSRVTLLFTLGVLLLAGSQLSTEMPVFAGLKTLFAATPGDVTESLLHYSWWPRLLTALLAGGGLALAGVILQQVLRNPLAAPTTLGIASGAQFALLLATLLAPGLLVSGREWLALSGGGLTMGLVFLLAWRQQLSPLVVVLAGLVVNLYLGALSTILLLFYQEELHGLMIWGAGSLAQGNWQAVEFLLPRVLIGIALAVLLLRPLSLLDLDEANAKGLGVSIKQLRLASLGLAVFIAACVVSAVGVIGFIGLAAPAIVRLLGARSLGARLFWATLLGALLLAATDLLVQQLSSGLPMLLPTGVMTAALGAPLLLWLIPRLKLPSRKPQARSTMPHCHPAVGKLFAVLGLLLLLAAFLALFAGYSLQGWQWLDFERIDAMLEWRMPRVLASAAGGLMLALAGTLLQRLTHNPMASPELLGISGGTALGLISSLFLMPTANPLLLVGIGAIGGIIAMVVLVGFNQRSGYIPERVLLTGIAITALFDAARTLLLAGGDPRSQQAIAWISGSTYYVEQSSALTVTMLALILFTLSLPFSRWLDLLPLGAPTAAALGVNVTRSRLALLLLAALLTACATLVVGPLSFVGLLAPHMARLLGLARAGSHMFGAALIGAILMILADWLGRQWLYPQEIPAGLVAALLGGAYFLWGLRRL